MNIDLNPDAAPSPEHTLQLAEAFTEIVRVLNHQTRHHEALRWPSDADQLLREISTAAGRLPQLLEQVTRWLQQEQEAGRIEVAGGKYPGRRWPLTLPGCTARWQREAPGSCGTRSTPRCLSLAR